MNYSNRDRTIALAGVFQAAKLVKQIANTGMANNAIIESSIESLFRFDTHTVEDVFGGLAGIGSGIRTLRKQFHSNKDRDLEVTRYVISLLVLEKKFSSDKTAADTVHSKLEGIHDSLEYFSLMHDNIFSKLGDLYKSTISPLGPKIVITSDKPFLTNQQTAEKVRALLLAGIRAAVLWRQCGGSRWHLLFSKKRYIDECDQLKLELRSK